MGKIDQKFSSFNASNHINSNLDAVRWCLENNLIQQGITILRETLVNYVVEKFILERQANEKELRNKEIRECAECLLNKRIVNNKEITDLWFKIIDYRNDINHAGWREHNYHESSNFEKKLSSFISKAEVILKGI